MNINKYVFFTIFLLFSTNICIGNFANAAVIKAGNARAGDVIINPLDLTGNYASFEEFYDFKFDNYSSNTGYEKANHVMIFMVKLEDELAMILTAGGPGGFTGALDGTFMFTHGNISFVNDPNGIDPVSGSTINWAFVRDKNDGLILSGLFDDNWSINMDLVKIAGGLGGLDVLSFDEQGNDSLVMEIGGVPGKFSINSVNAPSMALVFLVVLGLLVSRNK